MVRQIIDSLSGLSREPALPPAFHVMMRVREPELGGWVAEGVLAYSGMSPRIV
jgi:hypothetical protein